MAKPRELIAKYWKALLLGVVVLIVGGFLLLTPKETIPEYKFTKVSKGNVSVSLTADGKLMMEKRELSFEISGLVRGVSVAEGDEVRAWQTLAYLDTREAQKNLENEMKTYLEQRNSFDEMSLVTYPDGAVTDTIRRILEKNQWDLEKAVLDVELKDLALKKSYLFSPIDGVVVGINLKPGELATTSKVALTVVQPNSTVFEAWVEDIDALKISKDMKARIEFEAMPGEYINGKVEYVSPVAEFDENGLATYKVLVSIENGENLLDGMGGEVEIVSKEVEGVVRVVNSAVKREDGKSIVYLINDGELVRREVELGFTNGKEVEVKSGLSAGEEVVDWK